MTMSRCASLVLQSEVKRGNLLLEPKAPLNNGGGPKAVRLVFFNRLLPGLILALCFSGTLQAQESSVILYGTVDAGIASTRTADPGERARSNTQMLSGGLTDSLFGIRGREALSDGWSASFQFESQFDSNTGGLEDTQRLFASEARVGLGNNDFGEIRLGRQHTVGQQFGSQLQIASWKEMDMGATFKASTNYQVNQAVNYFSPSWAGFKFGVGYSFDVQGQGPVRDKSPAVSLALQYQQGPLLLVATWDKTHLKQSVLPNTVRPEAWQLGLRYDAGFATVSLGWSRQRNGYVSLDGFDPDAPNLGLGATEFLTGGHVDAYLVGLAVPVGHGEVQLQWSLAKPSWSWENGEKARSGQVATLGYVHDLSPRTHLYVMAGLATRYSLENGLAQGQGTTTRYMAGIAHSF